MPRIIIPTYFLKKLLSKLNLKTGKQGVAAHYLTKNYFGSLK